MASELPVELHRQIIRSVNEQQSLYALARTSRYFLAEAEPLLYKNVRLKVHTPESLEAAKHFADKVTQSPELASTVRTLEVIAEYIDNRSGFLLSMTNILRQLSHLDAFLFEGTYGTGSLMSKILQESQFPQLSLKKFRFGCEADRSLAKFVASQKELRHLELPSYDGHDLGITKLHQLRSAHSTLWSLIYLSGRQIPYVKIAKFSPDIVTTERRRWILCLKNVKVLSFCNGPKSYSTIFHLVAGTRFSVEYLEFDSTSFSLEAFYNSMHLLLSTRVRFVRFTGCIKRYDATSPTIQAIFDHFKGLEVLDFHSKENVYHRWYRDASKPVAITPNVIRFEDAWYQDWERDYTCV